MDDERRKTLETLLDLAGGDDPAGCWDPARAVSILRHQTTAEELEQIGASPALIAEIWPEDREG
ncbi:MAG TPA: hypothetical protein VMS56_07705 [Thermoanaerobaculia bacterium]|nr:hypothetical protein [Thermoanaerobaculia bacterium]